MNSHCLYKLQIALILLAKLSEYLPQAANRSLFISLSLTVQLLTEFQGLQYESDFIATFEL